MKQSVFGIWLIVRAKSVILFCILAVVVPNNVHEAVCDLRFLRSVRASLHLFFLLFGEGVIVHESLVL